MPRLVKFGLPPVLLLLGAAAFLFLTNDNDKRSPEALLAASADVMAQASFSHRITDCPLCPLPVVTEYAPPDRLMLSNSKGHDDWNFYLFLDGKAYFSSTAVRWLEGENDGRVAFVLLTDPRFLLKVTSAAMTQASEEVDGRQASVVVTQLDFDQYLQQLPLSLRFPELDTEFRHRLDGTTVRFWIDASNHRVLQLELQPPDARLRPPVVRFDYATPVDLPTAVDSMPAKQAQQLRREAEYNGGPLVVAIRAYRDRTGLYPPSLDPATLGDLAPVPWPTNPLTGRPMRQAPESAYDFDYRVKNGGHDMEITFWGWDSSYLYFDSVRFGELPPPRPVPPP